MDNKELLKSNELSTEKNTPFLKRIYILEQYVVDLHKKVDTVIKSLRKQ